MTFEANAQDLTGEIWNTSEPKCNRWEKNILMTIFLRTSNNKLQCARQELSRLEEI